MDLERMLQHRDKVSEDQIIFDVALIKTYDFTGLIEKSIITNRQTSALFLLKFQFEGMELNEIVEKVKGYVQIGEEYHFEDSNPFIKIYYDRKTRKSID